MAHTKQSCNELGRMAGENGLVASNPFKPDSWQANSWSDGYRAGAAALQNQKARNAAEAGQGPKASDAPAFNGIGGVGDTLAPFPKRMPHATREHLRRLNADALSTKCSTRALRLDSKISMLYQRYA